MNGEGNPHKGKDICPGGEADKDRNEDRSQLRSEGFVLFVLKHRNDGLSILDQSLDDNCKRQDKKKSLHKNILLNEKIYTEMKEHSRC